MGAIKCVHIFESIIFSEWIPAPAAISFGAEVHEITRQIDYIINAMAKSIIKCRLRNWLHHIRVRTLKIDILTLFTSLTIFTFTIIICYSYFRNYYAILNFSKGVMERNSTAIRQRVTDLQQDTELAIEASSALALGGKFSVTPELRKYMEEVVKMDPGISSFYIGFANGDFYLVKRNYPFALTHYVNNPSQPLPPNVTYLIRIIKVNQSPPEIWYYLDNTFKVITSENFPSPKLNVKIRPWYVGALQTKGIYWTDVFNFANTTDHGIGVSKAIYDKNNEFLGVVTMDISFTSLSQFYNKLRIGKYGQVFMTDANGIILVPTAPYQNQSKISGKLIKAVTDQFKKNKEHNFSFDYEGKKYLIYISDSPKIFDKTWIIVTAVPFSDLFSDLIKTQLEIILITLIVLGFSLLAIIYFSKRISNPIVALTKEIDKITNLDLSSYKRILSYIVEIKIMDSSIAAMRAALRSFSRYVPKEIVRQLLAQGHEIELHVDKKKLTILFSDIKDFTTIAENNPLSTLMTLLNEYFDGISKIIIQNQGTIDKYIGDSVMAIWGAPLANPQHAIFACTAALKCQIFVKRFNQQCRELGNPEFITRFGISSGTVVVGNIGTLERMNYTVIGDAVNIAARLQVTDKIYHVDIIISEEVLVQIDDFFLVRPLDTVEVKGKKTKIKIYELIALNNNDPEIGATARQRELCNIFSNAYQEYTAGNYAVAEQLFQQIHQQFPEDYPTEFYLDRLKKL